MAIPGYEGVVDYGAVGDTNVAIPQGIAPLVVVKATSGVLCRITITTLGSSAISIFDNAAAASGTVLFTIPANAAVGSIFDIRMPAALGIVVAAQTATTPAFTASFL